MISSDDDTETEKEAKEVQLTRQLRADLAAAKAKIQQVKEQAKKAQRDLLAEQEKAKSLQTEKDELTSQLTTIKAEQQNFVKEMLAAEEERLDLKNQVQHLTTQNTNLTTQLKHLATEKEEVTSKNTLLCTENIILRDETQRLKSSSASAAPPPTPQSTSTTSTLLPGSPAPSSIASTEEDMKLDNVRKVYTQLKRKQDILKDIVRQLMWCTRNMVLGEFGEFGVTVRRLREWMEEDEQQRGTKKQKQRAGPGG
ncbi:hypothetical protein COCC4DRAFT_142575 [Bipolaris maydis ATCC 48331]|uniref:GRIP domain-containing protein n=3 Tax=Cochliobolus heterostrophus TaxID=5016 RepID=M2THB1_COCH5|nr:uncharacterized protein COCC4DRAFT_142575 [Bipolaris maydis ATCC 48331]EMD96825.1 hypothetical protein COCHEDRAFT_1086989 [Bipolaris maydis C5]KAJ5031296.1 hypothetical protein J3E73DRAFT_179199 [Bipolaris maydis]ENI03692.1 hypothetical protein COCC4DRAFT_142575 [Bipolaris maydis ATCC 48331]KAJ6211461.1 hypothetical protein PSV09DRAFT_1086989 [Bipolaris maydis]KAJ6285057.1 hypothetical protein J3E71DRAFT_170916 [Bipolaris maydis]